MNQMAAAEANADAVRVAYYQLHNLPTPDDVSHRDKAVNAPDITSQLNTLMTEFDSDFKDFEASGTRPENKEANKLALFIALVKTGGRVDVKNSYFSQSKYYVYNSELYRNDDLGNIYFGYTGKVFGYNDTFLTAGAGLYQALSGTSDWSYISSYFDDPRDSAMIQVGINIYNKSH